MGITPANDYHEEASSSIRSPAGELGAGRNFKLMN
jgi:hypothetical protein